jgi:hypothetical protein|tara:strand:- start:6586 stop:7341 length:756 start_codon:yes stop_codon:yes gene_type:complete
MPEEPTKWMQCAEADLAEGVYSIPLQWAQKNPVNKEWQNLRLSPSDFSQYPADTYNRGRLLGIAPPEGGEGGWVVCVDLDSEAARQLAPYFLPSTGEIGGRAAKPGAHYFYQCNPPPRTRRFRIENSVSILDLLSTGSQVVVEPSIHPDGDAYGRQTTGARTIIEADEITHASAMLASACLIICCATSVDEFNNICAEVDAQSQAGLTDLINGRIANDLNIIPSLILDKSSDFCINKDSKWVVRRAIEWLD